MQVVRGDGEGGVGGRGDPEFAPEGVDVGLCVVHPGVFHHVVPCCGVSAVSTYQEVEVYGAFGGSFGNGLFGGALGWVLRMIFFPGTLLFEPGCLFVEIGACEFVVEMQGYVWHLFQYIQEAFVERCTVDG